MGVPLTAQQARKLYTLENAGFRAHGCAPCNPRARLLWAFYQWSVYSHVREQKQLYIRKLFYLDSFTLNFLKATFSA